MRKIFQNIAVGAFYIYVLGSTFLAAPYFNWQYAAEHGFVSWLLAGEIIATAKAAIWPYYAVMHFGPGPNSSDTCTDPHFANSRRASYEALKIANRFGDVTQLLSDGAALDVTQLLQASVADAELVEDTYLQQVHPEFQRRFREDYTGSLRNLADAIRTGDQAKLVSSAVVYNDFSDWVSTHAKELRFP